LLMGSAGEIAITIAATLVAIMAIAIALSGYLFDRLKIVEIILFLVGGIMLLTPQHSTQAIGFVVLVLLFAWKHIAARRDKRAR